MRAKCGGHDRTALNRLFCVLIFVISTLRFDVKRVVAIGLLFTFFFNVGGYYLLFWGLRKAAESHLAWQIENDDLDPQKQYEFKVPLVMPYPLQETDFVPASGTFEHEGQLYTLVRQKYENDTLHVVCVRDVQQNQLHQAMSEYATQSTDLSAPSGKGLHLSKLTGEFEDLFETTICTGNGWSIEQSFFNMMLSPSSGYLSRYSPPPDFAC